ncbi:MAG: chorismate synthase [Desulfovibrionaceae bacterium]|nr:chorismate synthase [Desulfovibrionaceae bacterium]
MTGNSFGKIFRLTSFGESHGAGIGGVVEGCPPGIALDEALIQAELDRRRPGQSGAGQSTSTLRAEGDRVKILSGVFQGKTTGQPIGFFIENTSQHSRDYDHLKDIFRPGHADYSWEQKFGVRDHRGGGRSSARETAARVAGGAVAQALLASVGISINAFCCEFAGVKAPLSDTANAPSRPFCAPDAGIVAVWEQKVEDARALGETLGGVVQIEAYNLPAGLGEPVFDGLDARLGAAFFSVGAVKGVEFGAGFAAARLMGSENNDILTPAGYQSNQAGGMLGGVSNGAPLLARVAIKPIPSVGRPQRMMSRGGEMLELAIGGRHDLSPIPRVIPVLRAMCALTLADFLLLQRCIR